MSKVTEFASSSIPGIVKHLTRAAVVSGAMAFSASAHATTIHVDFGVIPIGGTPAYTGASLDTSTAFDFGGGTYVVNQIGSGDQSTLSLGSPVSLTNLSYGSGDSGTLATDMIKTWTTAAGTFTETLSSFEANRQTVNALTLTLMGTLVGPGGISQVAYAILSANQVAGPGNAVNWNLTNTSSLNPVPLPAALTLFLSGLGGLGFIGWRKTKVAAAA